MFRKPGSFLIILCFGFVLFVSRATLATEMLLPLPPLSPPPPQAPPAPELKIPGFEIDSQSPIDVIEQLAAAGVRDFYIKFDRFLVSEADSGIENFEAWARAAAGVNGRFFPVINVFGPPENLFDINKINFTGRVAGNGYKTDFIPCPFDKKFLFYSLFKKLKWMAENRERLGIAGVILDFRLNLAGEVFSDDMCFCDSCFAGFRDESAPDIPADIEPADRKRKLLRLNKIEDYHKYLEGNIERLYTSGFISAKVDKNLVIGIRPYRDNAFFRAVYKAANSVATTFVVLDSEPGSMPPSFSTTNVKTIKNSMPDSRVLFQIPLDQYTQQEAFCLSDSLGGDGAILVSTLGLWPEMWNRSVPPVLMNWQDLLSQISKLRSAPEAEKENLDCPPSGSFLKNKRTPNVAVVFSGYENYKYRTYREQFFLERSFKYKNVRNTNFEALTAILENSDMVITAPGFNMADTQTWKDKAEPWRKFLNKGGLLILSDASDPRQTDWLANISPQLALKPQEAEFSRVVGFDDDAPFISDSELIPPLDIKGFFADPIAPAWKIFARDELGRAVGVFQPFGAGLVIATTAIEVPSPLYGFLWDYILKSKQDLEVKLSLNPILEPGPQSMPILETITVPGGLEFIRDALVAYPLGVTHELDSPVLTAAAGPRLDSLEIQPVNGGNLVVALRYFDSQQSKLLAFKDQVFTIKPWLSVRAEKNFYTDEKQAEILVERFGVLPQEMQSADRERKRLMIFPLTWELNGPGQERIKRGQVIISSEATFFSIPIETLDPGDYEIKWSASVPEIPPLQGRTSISKKTPSDVSVRIVRRRGGFGFESDGAPILPLGVYGLPLEELPRAREMGINAVIFSGISIEEQIQYLQAAEQARVKVILYPFYPQKMALDNDIEPLKDRIRQLASSRALLAWFLADSPDLFNQSPYLIKTVNDLVHEADPYHPTVVMVEDPDLYYQYSDAADILMVNSYPVPGHISQLILSINRARTAVMDSRPVWPVAQSFDWEVWNRRYKTGQIPRPTYKEMRNMAFQGLASGAPGLCFWAFTASRYDIRKFPEHLKELSEILNEIESLGPILLGETITGGVDLGFAAGDLAWIRKRLDAKEYLILVNTSNEPVAAHVSVQGWRDAATDYFDKTKVDPGSIELEPMGVRILEHSE